MRQLVLFIALVCLPPAVWASHSQPIVKPAIPAVYTVKKGDTLWDLSAHFLSNPWLWPKLWQANSDIKNPHQIYPGDRLHLIWVDGQPQLRLKRRVKLSPGIQIKRSPLTTLQESLFFPYLAEHQLVAPASLEGLPRVLGSSSGKRYISPGDLVWADTVLKAGELWWVYRPVATFSRSEEPEASTEPTRVLALKQVAKVRVAKAEGEISQVVAESLREEIRQNDVLMPAPQPGTSVDLRFAPSAPPSGIEAKVLGHLEGLDYSAAEQVVVLDRGDLDNVSAGHIFHLYRAGDKVQGKKGGYRYQNSLLAGQYQLGTMAIGEVMVIRPYESFSLAVVTRAAEPFRAGVSALPPVAPL